MHSSWAQHKTVVAQASAKQIRDLFVEAGRSRAIEGKDPMQLGEPGATWLVDQGALDLFLVDVRGGVPEGRLYHFVRVEAGELLLGVEPLPSRDPSLTFGLIAVGVTGTRVFELSEDDLRRRAERSGSEEALHGAVDVWVRRLSSGLSDREPPSGRVELQPKTAVDLEPGQSACAGPKTVWFAQDEGVSKLVGVSTVRPKGQALLPLTRQTWIEVSEKARVRVIDAEAYFDADPQWISIRRFHRFVLDCLARRRERALEDEQDILKSREETADRSVRRALLDLVTIEDADAVAGSTMDDDPLIVACLELGRSLGVSIIAPPKSRREGSTLSVEDVARASRVRVRAVVLPRDWIGECVDPMLGFLGGRDHPIALLPRTFGGYDFYDPATRTRERVTEKKMEELLPNAYLFYRPLPARKLEIFDLLQFGLRNTGWDVGLMAICGTLLGVLGMVVPYATGELVDRIIPSAELGSLYQLGAILIVVAVARTLIEIVRGAASLRLEMRTSSAMEAAIWDRLLGLPPTFFRKFSAGDLALRANGIETIRRSISGGTLAAVLTGLSSLLNLAVMIAYDFELAMLAVVLALGSVLIAAVVGLSSVFVQRELADADGKLSSLVLQLISGISKLRIAGAERRAFAIWAAAFVKKRAQSYKAWRIENAVGLIGAIYPTVMTIVVFSFVAMSSRRGELGTGDFLAFNAAFGIFVAGLTGVVKNGIEMLELIPIFERSRPLFEEVPEVDELKAHPGRLRGGIQVSHVSFRYSAGGPLTLDDVDFDIAPGELVAIVGSSAAGKSTLMRIMLGFEKPESGGIYYDRQELSGLDVTEVRRQIGVVLQSGQPVAGDILENILGARNFTLDQAWEAARMAGLEEDIRRMPMGMHTVLGQGGTSLSGGQRQRLMIARAIVTKPRILFFDEATSALDNATQAMVTESLEHLQATRVVIAHRLSTIKNADRIVVLQQGKIVQMGTYRELIDQEGVFQDMARRQIA